MHENVQIVTLACEICQNISNKVTVIEQENLTYFMDSTYSTGIAALVIFAAQNDCIND